MVKRDERFWSKVDIRGPGECWEWLSGKNRHGYGLFYLPRSTPGSRNRLAHRYAHQQSAGEIPKGNFVCHHCDNPPCCNPAHLFTGTQADNIRDCVDKGRNAKGENVTSSKLTGFDVRFIKHWLKKGFQGKKIAKVFAVSKATVSRINTRQIWLHVK